MYFQQGWNLALLSFVVVTVFGSASVLFGVLWVVYKVGIPGAFRVSAWVVAVCASVL